MWFPEDLEDTPFKIENKLSDTQYFKNQVEIDRGREKKQTQRQKDIFDK